MPRPYPLCPGLIYFAWALSALPWPYPLCPGLTRFAWALSALPGPYRHIVTIA